MVLDESFNLGSVLFWPWPVGFECLIVLIPGYMATFGFSGAKPTCIPLQP
jgi:hypothetical protein